MRIVRKLMCSDCDFEWDQVADSSDPVPDCPVCDQVARRIPGGFNRIGDKSKAIDMAQAMAEETYGLTDFNDNQRAGDIAAKGPAPMQAAEAEAIVRAQIEAGAPPEMGPELKQQAQNFWQTGTGAPGGIAPEVAMQAAAPAARMARAEGVDPVGLLHQAGKKGLLGNRGVPLDVVASDRPMRARK